MGGLGNGRGGEGLVLQNIWLCSNRYRSRDYPVSFILWAHCGARAVSDTASSKGYSTNQVQGKQKTIYMFRAKGPNDGLLWTWWWTLCYIKQEGSWLATQLLTSRGPGLCSWSVGHVTFSLAICRVLFARFHGTPACSIKQNVTEAQFGTEILNVKLIPSWRSHAPFVAQKVLIRYVEMELNNVMALSGGSKTWILTSFSNARSGESWS